MSKKRLLAIVLTLVMVLSLIPQVSYAAAGDPPANSKTLTDNGDGTYKLELSVTGDADYESEPVKANVIIVLDTSGSMDFLIPSTTGSRGSTATDGDTRNNNFQLYRNTGGNNYTAIADSDNYSGTVYYYQNGYGGGWRTYTGTRYSTTSRMDATKTSVNNLIDTLASQNTTANPDTIEMSLITFASDGAYNTPNSATANNWVSGTATTLKTTVSNLNATGGTNWDDALYRANALAAAKATAQPNEKVFIVFFSDGEPTFSNTNSNSDSPTSHTHGNNSNNGGSGTTTQDREANSAYYHANQIHSASYDSALYGIFAFGTEESYMKNVISYGNYGDATHASSVEGSLYFNANSPEDIENAFSKIASSIIEAVGITDVSITDGTTSHVETSTEPAELLNVDDESFEYWLSWNLSSGSNKFTSFIGGEQVECTATASGDNIVITWEGGTATYEGTITGSVVKVKWTGKTDFYDFDPPAASFDEDSGAVNWSLDSVGTLLNGVTYSVSFDVYPSQETLDTVADIKNDPGATGAWADLDPAIQQYIDVNGNLKTNTTATITYSDTRLDNPGPKQTTMTNPDPVKNSAIKELAVTKVWDNALESDWTKPTSIDLDVTRDGQPHYTVSLGESNSWTGTVYISIGIMGPDGKPLEGSEGHDFTFTEPQISEGFRWEIDAPTVHPMLINNVVTMLIKVDADHPAPSGATTYTFNNATYYVDNAAAALTATNERRSSLNLVKAVDGDDAPEDAVFPFTLNVVNSLAPESEPTNDPGHDSDWWVWISIWDKDKQAVTEGAVVSGATHAGGSWYYGVSGQNIVLNVKDGYSIRINNVPTGTTYTITEGNSTTPGFIFDTAEIKFTEGKQPSSAWAFTGDQTSTGSIDSTNAVYTVTYTNTYQLIDVNVDKVWDDNSNQDGVRPESLTLTLNGAPSGTTVPNPTITKSEDGNTWTYVWKGLPRFDADGNEITYTVTEGTVPQGYDCTKTTVNDGDEIKNVHTPETLSKVATKEWADGNNANNSRPSSVTFNLMKKVGEAEAEEILEVTLDGAPDDASTEEGPAGYESTAWEATFINLPKYEKGVEITYSITEDPVDKYATTITDGENGTTVTNTYDFGDLEITKTVDPGNGDTGKTSEKEFTFTVNLYKDSTKAETVSGSFNYTITNASGTTQSTGTISNGETVKLKDGWKVLIEDIPNGTYYEVTEATEKGYTTSKTGDTGTIVSNETKTAAFTNTYNADPVKAQIPVVKNVTPENSGAADITGKFTFTLAAGTNTAGEGVTTPMPSANTVACGADGVEVKFGEITFNAPGTYTYTVTESETNGAVGGITLDSDKPRTITVVVTDDGEGKLSAAVNGGATVEFNNPYQLTSLDITIPVEKILEVPTGLTGPDITEAYTFTIATTNNAPLPETKTLQNPGAAGGSMTFGEKATTGKITITEPGTYTYTITESGSAPGVTNDAEATKTVTVTVVNDGDGTMSYTINDADNENDDVTKFTNTYSAEPVNASIYVKKVLAGANAPDITNKFTFTIADDPSDDVTSPLPETKSGNNPAVNGGVVTFGPIEYTAPGTYVYVITESGTVEGVVNDPEASTGKKVTVVIVDGKEGALVVKSSTSTEESPLQFTNSYHEITANITVTKELAKNPTNLEGPDITGKYTFTIAAGTNTAGEGVTTPMPATTSVTNSGGAMQFGPITFKEPGEYTYTATESGKVDGVTNDTETKTVTIVVARNDEGNLTVGYKEGSKTSFDFVNTYTVKPVTAKFPVKKVMSVPAGLTGPSEWSYTIGVAAEDGAPVADSMTGTVTKAEPTVTFGDFTFTAPGTYTYTVTETATGEIKGVTDDSAASTGKTVQITVTDNKDGTLTATPSSTADNPLTFTNSYSATSITATIQVHKDLVAENPKVSLPDITEKYTFTLADDTSDDVDSPLPETKEVKNPAKDGGTVPFGTITYEAPGTYTYVVTESGTVTNVTNDPEATTGKKVTVEVVDGGEGKLVATVKYPDAEKAEVDFTNTYKAPPVEASFPVQKIVSVPDGLTGPSEWSYTIDVAANGTAPAAKTMTGTVTNSKDTVTFGPFSFTEPGEFTYTVKETGTVKGVTNDKEAAGKTVTVKVIDNGDGTLKATPSVSDESPLKFTNTYAVEPTTASFPVKKVIDVPKGLTGPKTWSFTIDVAANGSAPVAKTMTGTVDQNNDTVTFGDFTYTEPGTYTYKVTETGTVKGVTNDKDAASGKTVTVTVKDNGDGTLTATADSTADKPIEFTNTYSVEPVKVDPPVKKNIDGNESLYNKGDFTFKIECTKMPAGVEKAPMPDKTEVKNVKADEHPEKKGYYEFGWITFTVPGEYIYTVTESGSAPGVTNDSEATKTLKFTVTDGGEGVLEITPTSDSAVFEFTNTYGTKGEFVPEVTKVLDGRTLKAGEFKFTLSDSDGKVIDTKTNAADGKVTFDALSFTGADDGKTYTYTITEVKGTDKDVVYDTHTVTLTVSVKDNGDGTMTATGTYNGDQKFINTIEAPDTGDHSQIALWSGILIVSLLGIALLAVIKRKKPAKHSR
ncbi:MAG: Cna B-type domain-containing protein [Firmicutes bacterium]|nr:Cna B-type domain-containing protein [Bacillota bacterium]